MENITHFIMGESETITPQVLIGFFAFIMCLESIASIIRSLVKGVN